jgi:hypothetical protein
MAGIAVASEGDLTRSMASKRQTQNRETQSEMPNAKQKTNSEMPPYGKPFDRAAGLAVCGLSFS